MAANIGVCASVIWSLLLTILHQVGLVTKIWFGEEDEYHDQLFVPFDSLRIPLLITEVSLTFIFYVITIVKLKTVRWFFEIFFIKTFYAIAGGVQVIRERRHKGPRIFHHRAISLVEYEEIGSRLKFRGRTMDILQFCGSHPYGDLACDG